MGERGWSHIMFPRVDVDSLRVMVGMTFARAQVWGAHLIVEGVHLLNPIFSPWILIFIVKSPALQSIRVLETASLSFLELSLQRQVFSLIQKLFLRQRWGSFFIHRRWFMCGWKVNHFVKVGWSLFSRSQQHSHKDSNDEKGKDSSNYSSSYCYRRGLLKWNICKVTKIRLFKQF